MPQSKSTRKFEKNRLHDVLKGRKAVSKIKQKHQIAAKRKQRRAQDNERADDIAGDGSKKSKSKEGKDDSLGEMSMDQFFQGGFQLPEMSKKSVGKPKTGKRKRTPIQEDESSSSDENILEASSAAAESGSEGNSGDDADAHKAQLEALADKDPEFYKYLKENDAELLDFAEDADLAEIDALSASEDEKTPRKKHKSAKASKVESEEEESVGNEVTKKLIEKWSSSMEKTHSLRAMKEVALAFRACAHLNDDNGKAYKYSISDSNGMLEHPIHY